MSFRYFESDDARDEMLANPDNGEPAIIISRRISLVDPSVDPVLAKPKLLEEVAARVSGVLRADDSVGHMESHGD